MKYCKLETEIKNGCPVEFNKDREPCRSCKFNVKLAADLPKEFDVLFSGFKNKK